MPIVVFLQHGITACALKQRCDVGMIEFAFEDQNVVFRVAKPRTIAYFIRPLVYSVRRGKDTVSELAGAAGRRLRGASGSIGKARDHNLPCRK